ncbi:MAG TPA: LLM class flavin-dependent oxidoreductase [Actinocrinis sp.]|nr:LLM class flavin-dependent oxidoreductase [Actinocrinis sp.]
MAARDRRFRFGAMAAAARTAKEWASTAQHVEALGFSTLLCPDTTGTFEPFAALSAAAAATESLRLGTFVLASPLRTPGAVAWESVTLDALSGGRFELGLGAGRPDAARDAARLGLPFGSAAERIAQLEATIAAVRARFAGSDPTAQYDSARAVQQPGPPILLAATGPRMLRLAAQQADMLTLGLAPRSTEDDLAAKMDELRRIDAAAFDRLELVLNVALVGENAPPQLASWLGADPEELIRGGSIATLVGTPRQMADTLLRRRERTGVSYISVNAMFADQIAPVIELLADQ